MKGKSFKVFLVLLIVLSLGLGVAGCNRHRKHTYGDWVFNSETHWKECQCGDRVEGAYHTLDEGVVTLEPTFTATGIKTFTCTICEYSKEETVPMLGHTHVYGAWEFNETQHWKECECGDKTNLANHTFDGGVVTLEPTQDTTGIRTYTCSVCGSEKKETIPILDHEHKYEGWFYDEVCHWRICGICEDINSKEEHTFILQNLVYVCEICGFEKEEEHIHTNGPWNYDENNHWLYCLDCEEKLEDGEHVFGSDEILIEGKSICTICGYEKYIEHTHEYGEYKFDKDGHWKECNICNEKAFEEEHLFDVENLTLPTCDTLGLDRYFCMCGYHNDMFVPMLEHEYGEWVTNETHHWNECECSDKINFDIHVFDAGIITLEPTETSTGTKVYTCTICKYTKEETLRPLEHTHKFSGWYFDEIHHWKECTCDEIDEKEEHDFELVSTLLPTCVFAGKKVYECKTCGYEKEEVIDKLEHLYPDWESNHLGHWKVCILCSDTISNEHDFELISTTLATCNSEGEKVSECSVCGYIFKDNSPKLDHIYPSEILHDEETHWQICDLCGEKGNEDDHDYSLVGVAIPSCIFEGINKFKCLYCGFEKDVVIPKIDHDFDINWSVNCDYHFKECLYECGTIIDNELHEFTKTGETLSTCSKEGVEIYECDICEYSYLLTMPMLPHIFSGKYLFDDDIHYHECDVCGERGDVEDHDLEFVSRVEPTCSTNGEERYCCVICEAVITIILDKTPHDFDGPYLHDETTHWIECLECGEKGYEEKHELVSSGYWPSTCELEGKNYYTCNYCGYMEDEDVLALGHEFGDEYSFDNEYHYYPCLNGCGQRHLEEKHSFTLISLTPSTCMVNGLRIRECDICGFIYNEELDLADHDFNGQWYSNDFVHSRECIYECNTYYPENEPHTWDKGVEIGDGDILYTCIICNFAKIEDHEHDFSGDWVSNKFGHYKRCIICDIPGEYEEHDLIFIGVDIAPTCNTVGRDRYDCSICGERYYIETPKLEHDFSDSWTKGINNHWHACMLCGAVDYYYLHIPSDWKNSILNNWYDNLYHWTFCEVCDYEMYFAVHEFDSEHRCTTCGYEASELDILLFKLSDVFGNYTIVEDILSSVFLTLYSPHNEYHVDGVNSYVLYKTYTGSFLTYFAEYYYKYIEDGNVDGWHRTSELDEFFTFNEIDIMYKFFGSDYYELLKYAIVNGIFVYEDDTYVLADILTVPKRGTLENLSIYIFGNEVFIDFYLALNSGFTDFESGTIYIIFGETNVYPPHEHIFNQTIENEHTLKSLVSCLNAATYWYSCEICNEISSEFYFNSGAPLPHDFGVGWESDEYYHYHYCTECKFRYDYEFHIMDAGVIGSISTIYTCTVCGYQEEVFDIPHGLTPVDLDEFFFWLEDLRNNYIVFIDYEAVGLLAESGNYLVQVDGNYSIFDLQNEQKKIMFDARKGYSNLYIYDYLNDTTEFFLEGVSHSTNAFYFVFPAEQLFNEIKNNVYYNGNINYFDEMDLYSYLFYNNGFDWVCISCSVEIFTGFVQIKFFAKAYDESIGDLIDEYDMIYTLTFVFGEASFDYNDLPDTGNVFLNDFFNKISDLTGNFTMEYDNYWEVEIIDESVHYYDSFNEYRLFKVDNDKAQEISRIESREYWESISVRHDFNNYTHYYRYSDEATYYIDTSSVSWASMYQELSLFNLYNILLNGTFIEEDGVYYLQGDYYVYYNEFDENIEYFYISELTMEFDGIDVYISYKYVDYNVDFVYDSGVITTLYCSIVFSFDTTEIILPLLS